MRSFLTALWALPVAVLAVLFSVANRGPVTLSFDPFTREGPPEFSATLPLYALLFAAIAIGVVVGGVMSWLAQGRHRRGRRQNKREADRLRAETERLRARATGVASLPTPAGYRA